MVGPSSTRVADAVRIVAGAPALGASWAAPVPAVSAATRATERHDADSRTVFILVTHAVGDHVPPSRGPGLRSGDPTPHPCVAPWRQEVQDGPSDLMMGR